MFTTTLYPDFKKIQAYLPLISDQDVIDLKKRDGVTANLEYFNEEEYTSFTKDLLEATKKCGLESHFDELLYLILDEHERIMDRIIAHQNYYTQWLKFKELANFILTYLKADKESELQMYLYEKGGPATDPFTKSAKIIDNQTISWVVNMAISGLKNDLSAQHLFKEIPFQIFELDDENMELSIIKLQAFVDKKLKKINISHNSYQYFLCHFIHGYLKAQEDLDTSFDVIMASDHARFLVDVLYSLKYIDNNKPKPNDKHIHSLYARCKHLITLMPIA